jgi:phosphatidylinositol alpha-1,6-mannosyltransferase
MNILLLASEFPPKMHGGMANYSFNVANCLAQNNHVKVVSLTEFPVNHNYTSNVRYILHALLELRKLKKERDAVIYAISFRPEFSIVGLIARWMRIPVVFNGAGMDIYSAHPAFVIARKIACTISIQIICGASFQKELLVRNGALPERVHTVLGGVDTERFKPSQKKRSEARRLLGVDDRFVLLSLGRLVTRKGFDDAILSLTYLKEKRDIILLIIGDGPEKERLTRLARTQSMEDRVRFLGFVSSETLPQMYNAADVFVAPFKAIGRDMEGFPLVVQEAQASGVPVVSTFSAGLPELIGNRSSGFLVHENSPQSLAERILKLYEDKGLRRKMGQAARERAEALLDWETVAKRIDKILRETYNQQ